jgi:hypothetical protein
MVYFLRSPYNGFPDARVGSATTDIHFHGNIDIFPIRLAVTG